jgi:ribonuclease Z
MPNDRLIILGTGEAFDTGLGNQSTLLLSRTANILFDCGYQIPERLWLQKEYREVDAAIFSHLHADHCFGIVPLLMRFWEEGRRKPFSIIGRRGVGRYVRELFELGYPGVYRKLRFPIRYREVSADSSFRFKGLKLKFAPTTHSVENLAVRIDAPSWSLAISGDGQLTPESRALFSGVDLLVQELYSVKPKTPVHCDLETLTDYVRSSSVGRIGVTHHARDERSMLRKKVAALRRRDSRWLVLDPGMELKL